MEDLETIDEREDLVGGQKELSARVLVAFEVGLGRDHDSEHAAGSQPIGHGREKVSLEIVGDGDDVEWPLGQRLFLEIGLDGGDRQILGERTLTSLDQTDVADVGDGDVKAVAGEGQRVVRTAAGHVEQATRLGQPRPDQFDE